MNKEARSAASPLAQVWLFRFDRFSRRQGKRRIDFSFGECVCVYRRCCARMGMQ